MSSSQPHTHIYIYMCVYNKSETLKGKCVESSISYPPRKFLCLCRPLSHLIHNDRSMISTIDRGSMNNINHHHIIYIYICTYVYIETWVNFGRHGWSNGLPVKTIITAPLRSIKFQMVHFNYQLNSGTLPFVFINYVILPIKRKMKTRTFMRVKRGETSAHCPEA